MKFEARLPDESVNISNENPLREAGRLVAGLLALLLGLLLTSSLLVDALVVLITPEAEARYFSSLQQGAVGHATEGNSMSEGGELDPTTLSRLDELNALTHRLSESWPACPYEFRVVLVESPETNAFALPGGTIAVTRPLLDALRTESAWAFVLAHEIGHFRGRDHLERLGRGVLFGLVAESLGLRGGGASLVSLTSGELMRSHAVDQETLADAFAIDAVCAAFGDASGAAELFELFAHNTDRTGSTQLFSDHPSNAARVDATRRRADALDCPR